MKHVLIIEDDPSTATAIRDGLELEGYRTRISADGRAGLARALAERYDLLILDVMLPGMSGIDVCKALRRAGNQTPIIMLTARSQEIDKVVGLKSGADDYLAKPFGFMELLARIEAVLRRARISAPRSVPRYTFGDISIDFETWTATRAGQPLELSQREFSLLRYFIRRRSEVVTREDLLEAVWGYERDSVSRTADMHVAKLRKKIEDNPEIPKYLVTVHGSGYRFVG